MEDRSSSRGSISELRPFVHLSLTSLSKFCINKSRKLLKVHLFPMISDSFERGKRLEDNKGGLHDGTMDLMVGGSGRPFLVVWV